MKWKSLTDCATKSILTVPNCGECEVFRKIRNIPLWLVKNKTFWIHFRFDALSSVSFHYLNMSTFSNINISEFLDFFITRDVKADWRKKSNLSSFQHFRMLIKVNIKNGLLKNYCLELIKAVPHKLFYFAAH